MDTASVADVMLDSEHPGKVIVRIRATGQRGESAIMDYAEAVTFALAVLEAAGHIQRGQALVAIPNAR